MAELKDFKDVISLLDAETNRIAQKVEDLVDELAAGGLDEEEEADVLDDLLGLAERLRAIGAEPVDPVPAEDPVDDGADDDEQPIE